MSSLRITFHVFIEIIKNMVDVDYLSRMHNELIKTHVSIANRLSLVDRATRLEEYSENLLDSQL